MTPVKVARSAIHGRGVLAARPLDKGEAAFRIAGPLVPWPSVGPHGIQVWRDHYVEPRGPGRWLNHACAPSCQVGRDLVVRPRRALLAGDELTIDYCTVVLWEPWRMSCACGSRACRGEVRAWGRTPRAVRERYPLPLFAWVERGRVPADVPVRLAAGAAQAAALTPRSGHRTPRPLPPGGPAPRTGCSRPG